MVLGGSLDSLHNRHYASGPAAYAGGSPVVYRSASRPRSTVMPPRNTLRRYEESATLNSSAHELRRRTVAKIRLVRGVLDDTGRIDPALWRAQLNLGLPVGLCDCGGSADGEPIELGRL